jgi:hypothetical protein
MNLTAGGRDFYIGIFIETKKISVEKIKISYFTDKNPSFIFHT